ncbi:hypothetical protein [Streptomyces achromogenes]|uniref:hypothetical protein n=1 Tax=Streptomyces achromogenes TaxID=67255 RepID=UPI0027D7DED3|nr:hypothetical protein [Streptomyces achromogenes]
MAKNDGILPLAKGLNVAVIGPHADAAKLQFATYTYADQDPEHAADQDGQRGG